jgi:hypothetical protein
VIVNTYFPRLLFRDPLMQVSPRGLSSGHIKISGVVFSYFLRRTVCLDDNLRGFPKNMHVNSYRYLNYNAIINVKM